MTYLPFLVSRTFETFLENHWFCKISGDDADSHYNALHTKIKLCAKLCNFVLNTLSFALFYVLITNTRQLTAPFLNMNPFIGKSQMLIHNNDSKVFWFSKFQWHFLTNLVRFFLTKFDELLSKLLLKYSLFYKYYTLLYLQLY